MLEEHIIYHLNYNSSEWNGGTDNHYVETIPNTPKQMAPLATHLHAILDLQASLQTGS